jgi:hypothetical protein
MAVGLNKDSECERKRNLQAIVDGGGRGGHSGGCQPNSAKVGHASQYGITVNTTAPPGLGVVLRRYDTFHTCTHTCGTHRPIPVGIPTPMIYPRGAEHGLNVWMDLY